MEMSRRFGRKLKLPSTMAIKHQLVGMMLRDAIEQEEARPGTLTESALADIHALLHTRAGGPV